MIEAQSMHVRMSDAPQTERRGARRQRVLKGAQLSFNGGYGALECTVRNLSETGARLVFGETSAVPPKFQFRLAGEARRVQATVRWRSMTDIGISFD